jgi:hypothetical protein
VLHKYLFTDGEDLIELIEYNCHFFDNINENDIIKINNIIISDKLINEKYDYITNNNNIIMVCNENTNVELINNELVKFIHNTKFTNLEEISKYNDRNKTLVNIQYITYDVKYNEEKENILKNLVCLSNVY